jgi:hypothetical protein
VRRSEVVKLLEGVYYEIEEETSALYFIDAITNAIEEGEDRDEIQFHIDMARGALDNIADLLHHMEDLVDHIGG